ncbi:MAG: hypothetical protein ACXVYB_05155 [Arthrobacter sp.]
MIEIDDRREWRQTEHRIHRAEFIVVAALVLLTALTIAAALSKFVH